MSEEYDLNGNQIWRRPHYVYSPVFPVATPLPTVPVGATCGGCRYHWQPPKGIAFPSICGYDPAPVERKPMYPACRHYQEAAK